MSRMCPKCEIELTKELQGDTTLDVCLQCAGIWFDSDELNTIREQGTAALMQTDQQFRPKTELATSDDTYNCPACRLPMRRYHYLYTSPIQLDECEQCGGVWVDDGELEKMVMVLNEAKTESIPPEILDDFVLAQWHVEHLNQVARADIFKQFFRFLGGRLRYKRV